MDHSLQLGLALGLFLAVMLGFGLHFGARIFTKDTDVLHFIGVGIPVLLIYELSIQEVSLILGFNDENPWHCSLWQQLSRSTRWPLFSMVSTLEHPILHIQLAQWYVCIGVCNLAGDDGPQTRACTVQVTVAVFSIIALLILSSSYGFVGIWAALTLYMSLRAIAGFWR